ncbi:MAG: hypothetical protein Q9174_001334 [Haloplaca sp. 1 TL-2023]
MSTIKGALKAAKGALDAHQYDTAVEQANKVLQEDPKNYHANVFLGLAFEKKGKGEESEKAYRAATSIKSSETLAWQGLISLYEQQGGRRLDDYHTAAVHLATLFAVADDKTRCQTVLDKYTDLARSCGTRAQYKRSLEVLLPGSEIFDYLEGRIPHPSQTYTRIAELVEQDEKEKINSEIGQRRTRLGARIDQVTAEVKRDVLQNSVLETVYQNVIDWTHDDATRRTYEEKLLQHAYDTLLVLPPAQKPNKREQVIDLARGLVILKHTLPLAWKISLEWKDIERIEELDVGILREYCEYFPEDGLSKVLRAYLGSEISAFPKLVAQETEKEDEEPKFVSISAEDRLLLMTDGIEDSSTSVLAHRIMSEYYLFLDEYESAVDIARRAKRQVLVDAQVSGLALVNNSDAVSILLGTALVQYQAPRHHPEARSLFDTILARKPSNSSALLGIGLVLQENQEYATAIEFLERALEQSPDTRVKAEVAWCRVLQGDYSKGLSGLEECLPDVTSPDPRIKALKAQVLYRIGVCMWNMDESKSSRKDRSKAYARFISSLQLDMALAPAYTSLGIYYADYAKDRARARKCFQKAFELSSSEVVAAERLAHSFAKTSEWDLVEAVAQRVVESGRLRPSPGSKKKGISWPFAALGIVQLSRQDYPKSIVSFQSALRLTPKDYYSWVGLGESYHNSGRYTAATKALEQAQKLEPELGPEAVGDAWFSKYMLANVHRELGDYDVAIAGYKDVLSFRDREYGVSIASLQTMIEDAWHNIDLGFFGRAVDSVQQALSIAQDIATWSGHAFNLWKSIGDLCSIYTYVQSSIELLPAQDIHKLLGNDFDLEAYGLLIESDGVDWAALESSAVGENAGSILKYCCHAALLAYKRAISCCANDPCAKAVAWFNLGWSQHRAYVCRTSEDAPLKHLKAAVQCFKKAIEMESGNAEFWNALGVVTTPLNPRVAQHAFVRSLFLNEKSAQVWTNLGIFYLVEGDVQLANDAFARAQSVDPDHAQAWLGQGLLAAQLGEAGEARNLFTHSFEISNAAAPQIQRSYASSALDHLLSSSMPAKETAEILQPLLAVRQLAKQSLPDPSFDHIYSLLQERVGEQADTSQRLFSVCSTLEADYETTESTETLARFAQAKADLSRSQLAEGNFESAAENAETALALSEEMSSSDAMRTKIGLSAYLSAGLTLYYRGLLDESIDMFRASLKDKGPDPDIVCLLYQVLWAKGVEQERSTAREQLLDCVEQHPRHVGIILLLGAIAVLDNDRDTVEAVADDLRSLRTREDLTPSQSQRVAQLLNAIAAVCPNDKDEGSTQMSEATTAVMLSPFKSYGWNQLSGLSDDRVPAEIAVLTATKQAPPRGAATAEDVSDAFAKAGHGDDAQKSIMLAPWKPAGWEALSQI